MDKSECCDFIVKQILDNFKTVVLPSESHRFMNISDLLISIMNRKTGSLNDEDNLALNRHYCKIALSPVISKTYDELDALFHYLDFISRGICFHEVLYEIMCKKLK